MYDSDTQAIYAGVFSRWDTPSTRTVLALPVAPVVPAATAAAPLLGWLVCTFAAALGLFLVAAFSALFVIGFLAIGLLIVIVIS